MKRFFLFALVATIFAACATDQTQDVAVGIEAPETLTVSFDEESRIELKNGKTVWSAGDLLSVFYRSNANEKWQFQGQTGDRSGAIKRVANGNEATHELSNIVIVYPYNANYYINPRTYNVQATLPAIQTYLADSYGLDGSVMISSSEYKNFSLKNVCGWLKVQLTGNGEAVRYITLKGNNGEQVAGEIYINSENASCELAAESGIIGDDMQVGGSMFEEGTVLTKVTLDCGNGVTLGSKAKAFYIALPPQQFSNGLTIDIEAIDGSKMTKSTLNEITIERNAILPMTAFAYEGVVPEVFEIAYTTNDGKPLDPYTTDGFGANFVENVFDPATSQGALKFDGQMTRIPDRAFVGCSNLTEINITQQIKSIGAEAFNGCLALAVMKIPESVRSIGDKAFYHCSGMQEITIPKGVSIGVSSFEGCSGKANINCSIPYGYYSAGKFYKANFNEVVLGEGITSIGSWGFYNCSNIKKISIPNSLTYIDYEAFSGCGNIEQINISSLESWCKISFEDSTAHPACQNTKLFLADKELIDVVIPESVTSIEPYAFYFIKSIKSVTIHDKVTYIGNKAFYACSTLTNAHIGNRVTSIGDSAFSTCSSLTSVTIGNSVTSIGEYAFYYCSSLTSITIPDRVTSIGDSAFYYCRSLKSVTIPDSVTSIGDSAFRQCSSLTSVTIGNSVTSIGSSAFSSCSSLKEVYSKPTTPPSGGSYMFDGNASGHKIYVPRASVDAYKAAEYWSDYKSYIEPYDF